MISYLQKVLKPKKFKLKVFFLLEKLTIYADTAKHGLEPCIAKLCRKSATCRSVYIDSNFRSIVLSIFRHSSSERIKSKLALSSPSLKKRRETTAIMKHIQLILSLTYKNSEPVEWSEWFGALLGTPNTSLFSVLTVCSLQYFSQSLCIFVEAEAEFLLCN